MPVRIHHHCLLCQFQKQEGVAQLLLPHPAIRDGRQQDTYWASLHGKHLCQRILAAPNVVHFQAHLNITSSTDALQRRRRSFAVFAPAILVPLLDALRKQHLHVRQVQGGGAARAEQHLDCQACAKQRATRRSHGPVGAHIMLTPPVAHNLKHETRLG
jgi:hypothetical protein